MSTTPNVNPRLAKLAEAGQSIWIDNITREMLGDGTIKRYIDELSVTGLTSNPTIFEKAIAAGSFYDDQIAELSLAGKSGEDLFFELAQRDLGRAADLFKAVYDRTHGVDGWVSLEVSPAIVDDTQRTIAAAKLLHDAAGKENLYIKIPGTPEGVKAIEEVIFQGIPINVTLLFSREQYLAAAEAYMRGIERRVEAGLDPVVESVASLFISRWDAAVQDKVPVEWRNRLGVAIGKRTYKAYRDLLASPRWNKLEAAGAHPQRLLWASTGTKDPAAPDTLYVATLAAPDTVDTMPDKTLKAFGDHGEIGEVLAFDGGNAEDEIAGLRKLGIDDDAVAAQLQKEAADSFQKSWDSLLSGIKDKVAQLDKAASK
ncbi:MAG: transaldolase [Rhizobacter sp.]|nr:transaldolase [Rhizobacter sp.]